MNLNPALAELSEFPFARLQTLLTDVNPAARGLDLSIGDPKGSPPAIIDQVLRDHQDAWKSYPPPKGTDALRQAIAAWTQRRFAVALDPDTEILPVAGTKEALFLLATILVDQDTAERPVLLLPNPLYQVYLGAAVMAGAEPVPVPATAESGFLPDLDAIPPAVWELAVGFYLCAPTNPQGAVADAACWGRAIALCRQHGCVLIADECYSEIYRATPPTGALTVARGETGSLEGVVAFNSLSKRSNAAGLRVGHVAGDRHLLAAFLKVRRYGAATIPLPIQAAAVQIYGDEDHVSTIRADYNARFAVAERLLSDRFANLVPDAGFFLWLDVGDGEAFTRDLYSATGIKAVPGAYLSLPDARGATPGDRFVRLALVHPTEPTASALEALAGFLNAA